MQALYFIDIIYNRAQPWGHYICGGMGNDETYSKHENIMKA
jgi:hypothetical protein